MKLTGKIEAFVIDNHMIAKDIYSMWIKTPEIAVAAVPGQFITLYCRDQSRLLPRPISICEVDRDKGTVRLVFRVAGKGTKEFSMQKGNDTIEIMGPLGNGFTLERKKAILVGGGIGIPPIMELAKQLKGDKQIVLGYRNSETFMADEFEAYGKVSIATEDGSKGTRGNVIDAINNLGLTGDILYACGPIPMLRGIKAYAVEHGISAQISLEERMACGVGACLGCVCKSKETDLHTNVNSKRVCKDGPVFYAEEVEL